MPVSKSRKTRNKKSTGAERQTQKFKTISEIKSGIRRFDVVLSGVRFISGKYAEVTKAIPGYSETNPDVLKGLNNAIPSLQRVIATRARILNEVEHIRKLPNVREHAFFGCYNNLQELLSEFQQIFLPEFVPVVEALETLIDDEETLSQIGNFRGQVEANLPETLKTEV